MKRVSDHAADILRAAGRESVDINDTDLTRAIAERAGVKLEGPPGIPKRVINLLALTPGPLIPGKTRDGRGRLVRIFRLPETKGKK